MTDVPCCSDCAKGMPQIISLILIDAFLVVVTVAAARIAQRTWKDTVSWSDVSTNISGRSNESRIRIAAACLANAISIAALTLAGVLIVIAGAIGRSTLGRIAAVASALSGVAFLLFVAFSISIYLQNRPKRLIPPSLRNR